LKNSIDYSQAKFGYDYTKDEALNTLRLNWFAYADGFRTFLASCKHEILEVR